MARLMRLRSLQGRSARNSRRSSVAPGVPSSKAFRTANASFSLAGLTGSGWAM